MSLRQPSAWAAALGLALALLPGCGRSAPPSVLLIVIDTLRPDHLGIYGGERPTSPNLDRWARQALIFEEAWSTSSWTLPAFASMLTGLYPHHHGAGKLHTEARMPIPGALSGEIPTLAEALSAAGISTAAIVNNPFLHQRFGLNRGFGTYDYQPADNVRLRRADASVDSALEWMKARQEPFFLLLHLFDPHLAYDPPEALRGRFSGASASQYPVVDLESIRRRAAAGEISQPESRFIQGAYDEEIAFVDQQLDRLFEGLQELRAPDEILIFVTSDHGEEFFEHGGFEHGHSLHQEVARVPLLARGPGVTAGRVALPVSLADLGPTILDGFRLPPPARADGVSLRGILGGGRQLPPRALFAEGLLWGPPQSSILRWPHRLLLEDELGRVRLYDLRDDPQERHDLGAQQPELLADLLGRLQSAAGAGPAWQLPDLDQETLDKLKSLGYIR